MADTDNTVTYNGTNLLVTSTTTDTTTWAVASRQKHIQGLIQSANYEIINQQKLISTYQNELNQITDIINNNNIIIG